MCLNCQVFGNLFVIVVWLLLKSFKKILLLVGYYLWPMRHLIIIRFSLHSKSAFTFLSVHIVLCIHTKTSHWYHDESHFPFVGYFMYLKCLTSLSTKWIPINIQGLKLDISVWFFTSSLVPTWSEICFISSPQHSVHFSNISASKSLCNYLLASFYCQY